MCMLCDSPDSNLLLWPPCPAVCRPVKPPALVRVLGTLTARDRYVPTPISLRSRQFQNRH